MRPRCGVCGKPATNKARIEQGAPKPDINKQGRQPKFSIHAWLCDEHKKATEAPRRSLAVPRSTTAEGVAQTTIFDFLGDAA